MFIPNSSGLLLSVLEEVSDKLKHEVVWILVIVGHREALGHLHVEWRFDWGLRISQNKVDLSGSPPLEQRQQEKKAY